MRETIRSLRRPIESYNKVWFGALTLLTIGVVVAAIALVNTLDIGKARYTAVFAQAAQLASGDKVTIAGVSIGAVQNIKLVDKHVVVSFSINKNITLGADTRAAIKLTTILGSRYLELHPAGPDQLPSRTIELAYTEVPYDLQQTLAGATTTLGSVDAERIAESVRVMNRTLSGLPEALPQALANLNSLSTVVSARRDQLGTLLANTRDVAALLHRQKGDLGALVLQGNDILNEITARRAAMQRLFDGVTVLVDRAHTILQDEPQLDALLTNLHEFAQMMAEHDALLRNILQVAPVTVRNLANSAGSGNSVSLNLPAGPFTDSWMCALSGRAKQFNLVEYFKDCQ